MFKYSNFFIITMLTLSICHLSFGMVNRYMSTKTLKNANLLAETTLSESKKSSKKVKQIKSLQKSNPSTSNNKDLRELLSQLEKQLELNKGLQSQNEQQKKYIQQLLANEAERIAEIEAEDAMTGKIFLGLMAILAAGTYYIW